ncbi:hypothetical protein PC128_g21272 [Phytophthora cactorum]|nr:hypothetical protein PC128_g21272 [Phytophthora cactorum]
MVFETGKLLRSNRKNGTHTDSETATTTKEPGCHTHSRACSGRHLASLAFQSLQQHTLYTRFPRDSNGSSSPSSGYRSFLFLQEDRRALTHHMPSSKTNLDDPAVGIQPLKTFSRGSMMLLIVTLLLAGVVACDLAMEMNILSSTSEYLLRSNVSELGNYTNDTEGSNDASEEPSCSPKMVNLSQIEYHSNHRYFTLLKEVRPQLPPVFRGDHTVLCNDSNAQDVGYAYCLPISGRKDSPFCTGADRMDLLTQHSTQTRCYASVLHMLLVEVYEELYAFGKAPLVVYGSLLGAVRNGSMIPFTEDTDIAYSGQLDLDDEVGRALVSKGYHFFYLNIWRVCVAPTHPLAASLYNSRLPIAPDYSVPYLDLYGMKKLNETDWSLEKYGDSTLPAEKVESFSQVTINGLPFDTVHDPDYFLKEMYGDDYMIPKPRK